MSDTFQAALDTAHQPARKQLAAHEPDKPRKVPTKVKHALDVMVWTGACRAEAAAIAKITHEYLCAALKQPHIKAYYLDELQVLRISGKARNVHALERVRDQDGNGMATVNAVKALEQLESEPNAAHGSQRQAGIVIVVGAQQPVTVQGVTLEGCNAGGTDASEV